MNSCDKLKMNRKAVNLYTFIIANIQIIYREDFCASMEVWTMLSVQVNDYENSIITGISNLHEKEIPRNPSGKQ